MLLRDCYSDDGKQCSFQHSEAHSTSLFLSHGLLSVKMIFSEDFLCPFWSLTATGHYKLSLHDNSGKMIHQKYNTTWIWNKMRTSKQWQNFPFWVWTVNLKSSMTMKGESVLASKSYTPITSPLMLQKERRPWESNSESKSFFKSCVQLTAKNNTQRIWPPSSLSSSSLHSVWWPQMISSVWFDTAWHVQGCVKHEVDWERKSRTEISEQCRRIEWL